MKRLALFIFLFILGIGAFIAWWKNGIKAVNPVDKSQKIFVVEKGESVREIGNNLKKEGFIKDPVVFFLLVKKEGIDTAIQAGDYRLSSSMNLREIIQNLQHGTLDVWVTVPEGKRAAEIAEILKQAKLKNYQDSWRDALKQYEGYLFPDSYLIPKDANIDAIVSIMRNNFNNKITKIGLFPDQSDLLNIVIIASLIEREAKTDAEKPLIAGVIANRLEIGMSLQIDATIQYAKGYDSLKKTWWQKITFEDYKSVKSPYNTYLVSGLPPAPISNPGLPALSAAAKPANVSYLYYLHDRDGKIHFAKTVEEHNRNVEKYIR